MINALVLAAGESRRMGMPKPLLRFPRSMGVPPMSPRDTLSLDRLLKTNPELVMGAGTSGIGSGTLSNEQSLPRQDARGAHGRDGRVTHGRDAHATDPGDTTFLEQIVSVLQQSEVGRITVVLGAQAAKIQASTDLFGTDVVLNKDYREGQLSSLLVGLRSLPPEAEAILLCLVDNPFVTGAIVDGVVEVYRVTGRPIVVPVFEGRRGHPSLFARTMFDQLFNAPPEEGARHVVHANADRVFEVNVPDPAVLARIDTPEDYLSRFGIAPRIMER